MAIGICVKVQPMHAYLHIVVYAISEVLLQHK